MMHLVLSKLGLVLQLDPQELVEQLQIHEVLVVTLALLQLVLAQLQLVLAQLQQVQVPLVQRVRLLLVQQVLRLLVQQVLRLVQVQVLVVVPLELEEHPYLPKKFGVPKNVKRQENLAYLF
jgi:hypothetical protein